MALIRIYETYLFAQQTSGKDPGRISISGNPQTNEYFVIHNTTGLTYNRYGQHSPAPKKGYSLSTANKVALKVLQSWARIQTGWKQV